MSSASSAVTCTSVYTDFELGRVFWGAGEELLDGSSPRVIVYGYDRLLMQPIAPPSPDYIPDPEEPQTPPVPQDEDEREPMFIQPRDHDYVPEPMYPEYIPLEDEHVLSAEEQPLPHVVSPTSKSPRYVAESDPEEDPEEYEDDESEDGPIDYPMDGGDNGDDDNGNSSGDDADDDDEDEEDEEEEEEHLALADFVASIPLLPEAEVERRLAMPTPPPSPLTSLSPPSAGECLARCTAPPIHSPPPVPSPLLPSSGCPTQIRTLRMASTQAIIDAVYVALPSPPLPPLPPPLYIPPPVDRMDDILETEMPPRKRSCLFALGSRYEIGESSTARPTGGRGIDYGFVSTLDVEARRQGIGEEVHYELQTHSEQVYAHEFQLQAHQTQQQLQGTLIQTQHQVHETHFQIQQTKMAELRETDRRRQAQMAEILQVMRDMRRETGDMQAELQIMAPMTRQGPNIPPNNTNPNNMTPESVQAMIDQALLRNSTNGDVKFSTCTLLDANLTWWNGEIKKLEIKLWNLKVKGNDVPTYTERFQELTLICTKFVANETEKIDKYISGLPDNIYGSVKSSKPKTLDETIELANDFIDQKLRAYAERQTKTKGRLMIYRETTTFINNNPPRGRMSPRSSGNTNVVNTQMDNREIPKGNDCFECGSPGHFKRDCLKLKNKDGGNVNAQGWVYAVGNAEKKRNASKDSDSNVVMGTFLLNNRYASILFDTGADRSFIFTAFSSLIDIVPTTLGNSYDVELADGKIVGVDTIIRGCTLNFLNQLFNIDLMPIKLGSFDVIISMDWLRRCHAVIMCHEKLVRVPYGNETLIFCSDESNDGKESRLAIISCFKAQEYMAKGCQIFLAQISAKKEEDKSEGKQLKDVPIVRDFPELFPEDLSGLPPARPVEFHINLIPGAAPVAQAPYRLAPSEMKELSKQLQELSDKGFIRPSSSRWGALRKPMEFEVGDMYAQGLTLEKGCTIRESRWSSKSGICTLKVSPWKRVVRFGKRGKLNPRYVRPFKVLTKVGKVAYNLELPQELSMVHHTFHVSNLKKCYADEPLVMPSEGIHIDDKLQFMEEHVEIIEREVKRLKQSRIPLVKVRWNSRRGPKFTWEREDSFKKKYPQLFTNQASSSTTSNALGYLIFLCHQDLGVLHPSPSVDHPAPEVIAPIAEVVALEPAASTGSPSSTTVNQDAPSPSNSQTIPETQSPILSNDVEEDNHDLDVEHMNNDPFFEIRFDSCDRVDTPMVEKSKLDEDKKGKSLIRHTIVARPTEKHLHAVKRIFWYLRGTVNERLWYLKDSLIALTAFADADHAGCQDTCRSTFGSMQFLGAHVPKNTRVGTTQLKGSVRRKAKITPTHKAVSTAATRRRSGTRKTTPQSPVAHVPKNTRVGTTQLKGSVRRKAKITPTHKAVSTAATRRRSGTR
nr:reverse transcriptase domain-containing protein [Tanacetum cinerariifolium]